MKLCKPSFEILEQPSGLEGIYKQIEVAGRTCYKSEDKITEDSAPKFVERMVKSGHGATLEFGTVYLKVPKYKIYRDGAFLFNEPAPYTINLYYKTHWNNDYLYITTNYRYIIENKLNHWLQFLCEPTYYHEKRICVKFICDRAIANEFVRHRKFSFLQESTRYCKYSADKFNNELTFIKPCWLTSDIKSNLNYLEFEAALQEAEKAYLILTKNGWKAEEARNILPLALKTELVMTGFISDWQYFFGLRCDKAAHPQARELAIPLREEFIKKGYITE